MSSVASECQRRLAKIRAGLWKAVFCLALLMGTAASGQTNTNACSEFNFLEQVASGFVIFDEDCNLVLSNTVLLAGEVEMDASLSEVTIRAGASNRLFIVATGAVVRVSGITFSGGYSDKGGAFYVQSGGELIVENCTFINNQAVGASGEAGAPGQNSSNEGGNARSGTSGNPAYGGAIYNLGTVSIIDSVIATNRVSGGSGGDGGDGGNGGWQGGHAGHGGQGAPGSGGAIYSEGFLSVSNCLFQGNEALGGNGGSGGDGGDGDNRGNGGNGGNGGSARGAGICSLGSLLVTNCTFNQQSTLGGDGGLGGATGTGLFAGQVGSGGSAGVAYGGGVYSESELFVTGTTFSANLALGGVPANGGTAETGNGTDGHRGGDAAGAGVFNRALEASLVNSTFYRNHAEGGPGANGGNGFGAGGDGGDGGIAAGGGLYNQETIHVLNCTFFGSSARGGTNGVGGTAPFPGENGQRGLSLGGNLRNFGSHLGLKNTIVGGHTNGANGAGIIIDEGNNISSDASIALKASTSLIRTNPRLGPLQNNGGPTLTMMPLTNSPAIDAGDAAAAPEEDQRGFVRGTLDDPEVDIGAVEGQVPLAVLPASASAALGGNVTLSASVTGDLPIRYQWQFHGTNLPNRVTSTLVLQNLVASDAGPYQLVLSNAFGIVASPIIQLVIGTPVTITTQPLPQLATLGSNVTMTVTATGAPPLGYQWFFQGARLTNRTSSSLTITNVQLTNAGTYSVTITNPFSSVMSTGALLRVVEPTALATRFFTPTSLAFAFPARTGVTYVLQTAEAVESTNWQNVRTNVPVNSGQMTNILEILPTAPKRYFRLQAR